MFCMETRLRNILRRANVTELIKAILGSSYKVLLGPYVLAIRTQRVMTLVKIDVCHHI